MVYAASVYVILLWHYNTYVCVLLYNLFTGGRGDPPGGMMFQPSMHPGQYHNQMQTMRGHPGMPPIMRPGSHPQYLMNTPQQGLLFGSIPINV